MTELKLYNSLTKKVESVHDTRRNLTIYSCGPTVYNRVHLGNLLAFISNDVLRRSAKLCGYHVRHVMNITDVDDKTIQLAMESGPQDAMDELKQVTQHYEELFMRDIAAIGNEVESYEFVRATESIDAMQHMVRRLHQEGIAYTAEDGVYFSIDAYQAAGKIYGKLAQLEKPSETRSRIDNDEYDKLDMRDFALWKRQKDDEPAWQFKLDGEDYTGRPGWHIECSAMIESRMGAPISIHTGGVDLKFPHHENEIAQSGALNEQDILAHTFMHNEHLLVDGKKMSKSLHNFYTLTDLEKRDIDPLAFRLLALQSHYRHQANFSWDNIQASNNRLNALRGIAEMRWQATGTDKTELLQVRERIITALSHDIDTPKALSELAEAVQSLSQDTVDGINRQELETFITFLDEAFGLQLAERTPDISQAQYELVQQRLKAKQQGDYQAADQLRDRLAAGNVYLRDEKTSDGKAVTLWSRYQ